MLHAHRTVLVDRCPKLNYAKLCAILSHARKHKYGLCANHPALAPRSQQCYVWRHPQQARDEADLHGFPTFSLVGGIFVYGISDPHPRVDNVGRPNVASPTFSVASAEPAAAGGVLLQNGVPRLAPPSNTPR